MSNFYWQDESHERGNAAITALAPKGDGLAAGPKGPVYVPFTVPAT